MEMLEINLLNKRTRKAGALSWQHIAAILFPALAFFPALMLWDQPGGPNQNIPVPGSASRVSRFPSRAKLDVVTEQRLKKAFDRVPVSFEANRGQADPSIKFLSRGNGYSLLLTATEAVLVLREGSSREKPSALQPDYHSRLRTGRPTSSETAFEPVGDRTPFGDRGFPSEPVGHAVTRPQEAKNRILHLQLIGANPSPKVTGIDELPGKSNYFVGSDSAQWRTDVPTYAKVKYREVYPGVDLIFYGSKRQLEYDFVLSPGADPKMIRFAIAGADESRLNSEGDLVLRAGAGEVRVKRPVAYQELNGVQRRVGCGFSPGAKDEMQFEVEDFDPALPLVIDPVIVYGSYLGGTADDVAYAIEIDPSGNAYVFGYTHSGDFMRVNARQPNYGGASDAFVVKLAASGNSVYYSTYLGGSGSDYAHSGAVDASGAAYVVGLTHSTNFPTFSARQPAHAGGQGDAFVAKLGTFGNTLVYSTYHGGTGFDSANGIAVDVSGAAYTTGYTASTDFPMFNARQPVYAGGLYDAFVTKFSPSGNTLVYSTYHGGSDIDFGNDIAVDLSGSGYLTGSTFSSNFPTANARQPMSGGIYDAYISKFSASGTALVYSTYHGGSDSDQAYGIAVDSSGAAYLTGHTGSSNFPTANAHQPSYAGFIDAFISKISPTGSALLYSTYHGGSGIDGATAIALNSVGDAYVTGETASDAFLTTQALVARLNASGNALIYSASHGGTGQDRGYGIAVDSSGTAYIAGVTDSADFPTMNPVQPARAGARDAFVIKFGEPAPRLEITMSSFVYAESDTIIVSEFRMINPGSAPVPAECKVWLRLPGLAPISILNLGTDGSFILPPGLNQNLGPFQFLVVSAGTPRGPAEFSSHLQEPVTGMLMHEDRNPFFIR
jgi:hypothetical protein